MIGSLGVVALLAAVQAQGGHDGQAGHTGHGGGGHASPTHAPLPGAGVPKSLTAQQVADLRAGRGMGLARSAELGGYPGPLHVLENAAALGLSATQRTRTQALFNGMKAQAVPLGEMLVAQEAALDLLFADRTASEANVAAATRAIGDTSARLRAAHLRTHLAMMKLLTPAQVARYAAIRSAAR